MLSIFLSAASCSARSLSTSACATRALPALTLSHFQTTLLTAHLDALLPSGDSGEFRNLSTSSSASANENALSTRDTAAAPPPAAILSSSFPLHLDCTRTADPGESRYTAPYWIPEDVRRRHHLPAVLFTDPWLSREDPKIRRIHAKLCLDQLRKANQPLTAEQVREAVNEHLRTQPSAPPLATPEYAKHLMEHLRRTRLLYGRKNPDSLVPAGHPTHNRLYAALPYQIARMGDPQKLAAEDAKAHAKAVELARKRVRRGKPPYAIHRRRAQFSLWQHEQLQESMRELMASSTPH